MVTIHLTRSISFDKRRTYFLYCICWIVSILVCKILYFIHLHCSRTKWSQYGLVKYVYVNTQSHLSPFSDYLVLLCIFLCSVNFIVYCYYSKHCYYRDVISISVGNSDALSKSNTSITWDPTEYYAKDNNILESLNGSNLIDSEALVGNASGCSISTYYQTNDRRRLLVTLAATQCKSSAYLLQEIKIT